MAAPAGRREGDPEADVAVASASQPTVGPEGAYLLEVAGLHKRFGEKTVLEGVDFQLKEGEKVCIIGPSGSGKTSLLRCLNLLIEPSQGQLFFRGDLIGDWPDRPPTINLRAYRRRIGMV